MRHPSYLSVVLAALLLAGCNEPAHPTVNLYRAVQIGDLDQIRRHIYWRTDLNQADPRGDFPLHVAARAGQVNIARDLAEHGASLVSLDSAGHTPLELALLHGKTQVAAMLLDKGAPLDAQATLVALVQAGVSDRDSVELLIRRGADLNRPDPEGRAPLHLAVSLGHLESVKRLLLRGADLNLPDGTGKTPLALARELDSRIRTRAHIQKILEQSGARP
jgi:ankyrin repeat protein